MEAIRRALPHPDTLARHAGAALTLALRPEDPQVERALVSMLLESDPATREIAARALAHLPGSFEDATLERVIRAADISVQRIQHSGAAPVVMALAWTLRAVARRIPTDAKQEPTPELRALGIVALNLPGQHRPLEVASLELLDTLSLRATEAWPDDQLNRLISIASGDEAKSASHAADILVRIASQGLHALDRAGANLLLDPQHQRIPLLARSASDAAYQRLSELGEHDDPEVRHAAHDALASLRRRRNDADFIEAHFIPGPSKD
ncbi:hypothetical protein EA187_04955 [Lujinxingia sediminis]|uniref:HEAT repeat domain-containing protein n=1 Tax=Lujinxingia sediminis TaxID=2480984 RepID=A0ABY0CY21_9DELT|nr:hypothetical protein EA187_04955 [Lujinxingia sediminis]